MLEIDTNKISSCGDDIIKLSQDFGIIIDDLFSDINKLVTNNIWLGNSASQFVSKVNLEKTNYIDLKKVLYSYGTILKQNAENYNSQINKTNM